MDKRILDLNFAQLSKAWSKSKFNNYSDAKKQRHVQQLHELYNSLKVEDFSSLKVNDVAQRSYVIDFFFKNLEFLENSTFNLIPFELVECLKYALGDWLDNPESYIIVTSLVNNLMSYSFDPILAIDFYPPILKAVYNLEFDHKLIQINIPRFLVRDYLASVVLYHELGHFIDSFYDITSRIAQDIANKLFNSQLTQPEVLDLIHFFPFIQGALQTGRLNIHAFASHIAEYFCDIFAAQYVGDCLSAYLLYITKNQNVPGPQHPASTQRVEMVRLFLASDNTSYTLRSIINATQAITARVVAPKYQKFKEEDLLKLLPADITYPAQLHYLFVVGWKIWNEDYEKLSTLNNIAPPLSDEKIYEVINNLIEKSIGNFIVVKNWNKIIQSQ
jgi:hypothetical protein